MGPPSSRLDRTLPCRCGFEAICFEDRMVVLYAHRNRHSCDRHAARRAPHSAFGLHDLPKPSATGFSDGTEVMNERHAHSGSPAFPGLTAP